MFHFSTISARISCAFQFGPQFLHAFLGVGVGGRTSTSKLIDGPPFVVVDGWGSILALITGDGPGASDCPLTLLRPILTRALPHA